ncbi:MAG: QueT transporter family protein [Myxococcales bacterium]|jgi:energy-coupling factor transport system substrate-specific component|nr:QueT transporter family protein [Myxococcales bacterium]
MHELILMWRNTRMVVLTAMCASFYAAVLIPFLVVPIIPGVTHFRPANALPVVCSFLFGPAAVWGAAIGNLIGDFFTGLGPGDLFGFIGNFLYALAPYRLWRACASSDPVPRTPTAWLLFVVVVVTGAGLCAATVGFGLQVLGFVPFAVLANVVIVNNSVTALVLAPLLLAVLYPRVRRVRLLHGDIMGPHPAPSTVRLVLGVGLAIAGALVAFVGGNCAAVGVLPPSFVAATPDLTLAVIVLPGLALAAAGLALL